MSYCAGKACIISKLVVGDAWKQKKSKCRTNAIQSTYALGGDDLGPLAVLEPRGLPLPDLCVVVALGGAASDNCEGADAVRELDGDDRSEGKDGLSWGAGEGAMAMAALIVTICPKVLLYRSLNDILSSARLAIDLSVYRSDVRWVSGGKIPVHNCLLFNGFFLMREKRMRISSPADRCRGKRPINEFNRLCKFLIPRCKASTKRVRETERRAFGSCFIFMAFFPLLSWPLSRVGFLVPHKFCRGKVD